jgi:hypothetical protein
MGQVVTQFSASSENYPELVRQATEYPFLDFGSRTSGQFRVALENVPSGLFDISVEVRTTAIPRDDRTFRQVALFPWKTMGKIKFMIGALENSRGYLNAVDLNPEYEWKSCSYDHKVRPGERSKTIIKFKKRHRVQEGKGVGIYISYNWTVDDRQVKNWQLVSIM